MSSESTPIGNERAIRSEMAIREKEEAERLRAERAERKRLQEAERAERKRLQEAERAERKRLQENEARQRRAALEESLKDFEVSLSVSEISSEFKRNSARAEDWLKGKRIRVTGFVGTIDDSTFSEKTIYFRITDGEFMGGSVSCRINRSDKSYQRFDRGQPVVMIGRLVEEQSGVKFEDCYFP